MSVAEVAVPAANALLVADLEVAFGRLAALAVPSLTVAAGSRVAIAGPSGSGKTTLAHALTGIQPVTRGRIRWGDVDLARLGESARDAWRRRRVGLVFQEFHLVPGLSPLMNVLAPCYFAALRPSAAQVARARELLERMEVPDGRSDATLLSRGEQQRVAIARALLHDPPILVADEPTAALDEDSAARIITLLTESSRESGRTLLTVTHDPALIAASDRVIRLAAGRIVEDGAESAGTGAGIGRSLADR